MKKLIFVLALLAVGCSTPRALPTERIIILHVSAYGDTTVFDTGKITIVNPESIKPNTEKVINRKVKSEK